MPLNPSTLIDAYQNIFVYVYHEGNDPSKPLLFSKGTDLVETQDAANAWADAYRLYADDAVGAGGSPLPLSLDLAQETLALSLGSAFQAGFESDLAVTIGLIALAFTAFWTLPLVTFDNGAVVTLATPPLTGVLIAALTLAWPPTGRDDNLQVASDTATALDIFTRTVFVQLGVNPPVPLA